MSRSTGVSDRERVWLAGGEQAYLIHGFGPKSETQAPLHGSSLFLLPRHIFQLENLRLWKNKYPQGERMRCSSLKEQKRKENINESDKWGREAWRMCSWSLFLPQIPCNN